MDQKLMSNRMNFPAVDDVIDEYAPQFARRFNLSPDDEKHFRIGLRAMIERLFWEIEIAAAKGSERGIKQALALMLDPKFYEVVKKRKEKTQKEASRRFETYKGKKVLKDILGE